MSTSAHRSSTPMLRLIIISTVIRIFSSLVVTFSTDRHTIEETN